MMRCLRTCVAIGFLAGLVCPGLQAANPGDSPAEDRRTFVRLDYLSMGRSDGRRIDTTVFNSPGGSANDRILLSTDQISFDEGGIRFVLGRELGGDLDIALIYTSLINDWEDRAVAEDTVSPFDDLDALFFSVGPGLGQLSNFTSSFRQSIGYSSDYDSLELNYRHTQDGQRKFRHAYLGGIRYFGLNESFWFISEDIVSAPVDRIGRYELDTDNRLIGGQVGASFDFRLGKLGHLGFSGKTGIALNFISGRSTLNQANAADSFRIDSGKVKTNTTGSFLELGISGEFPLGKRLLLYVGYELLSLHGVALAPEQFDYSILLAGNQPIRDDSGDILFHSPYLGLQYSW